MNYIKLYDFITRRIGKNKLRIQKLCDRTELIISHIMKYSISLLRVKGFPDGRPSVLPLTSRALSAPLLFSKLLYQPLSRTPSRSYAHTNKHIQVALRQKNANLHCRTRVGQYVLTTVPRVAWRTSPATMQTPYASVVGVVAKSILFQCANITGTVLNSSLVSCHSRVGPLRHEVKSNN